ncbi:MAG: hypothetical protein VYB44_17180 [Bacteroidota bacterium]|nr:hypothetical protein [Bacteroidota bacterium]
MKYTLTICIYLFVISIQPAFGQSSKSNNQEDNIVLYNPDVIKIIKNKWNTKEVKLDSSYKFKRIVSFFDQLKVQNEGIVSTEHLSKPESDILVANYLNTKLTWNRFNQGKDHLSTDQVINIALKNLPQKEELMAFYYNTIFIHLLNNQSNYESLEINLDYQELGLNEKEGTIMFLSAMRHIGRQMYFYSSIKYPDNCFRAKEFLKKIPLFNGRPFFEVEIPEFEDFQIEVDKRYPKVSFQQYFIPEFEAAKNGYKKCLQ